VVTKAGNGPGARSRLPTSSLMPRR